MQNTSLLRVFTIVFTGFAVGAPVGSCAPGAAAENEVTKATIYLDAKAPSSVKLAAKDLREHIQQITGKTIPVSTDAFSLKGYVIYLGDTAFARKQGIKTEMLPPDGFRILSNKNWMVVAGRDYSGPPKVGFNNPFRINESYNSKLDISAFGDAGTLFGAYYFLERYCGVRWYMPGTLGTVIPRAKKIAIPSINVRRAPAFEQRHAYYGFMDRSDDDTLWYRRAGFGSPAPLQVNHSFGFFFLKYKDTHPEYFALIDGQRDFTNLSTIGGGGNLNLSNKGLIQAAIDEAIAYFDQNPEQKIFPLSPNDGMTRISEDPESQAQIDKRAGEAGEFSNYIWGFINKVAIGVAKKYPDKLVGCIAYERYSQPPTNIERLAPNVAVVLTKFRAMYPTGTTKADTEKRLKEWSKKASHVYTWEYYCNTIFNPGWKGYPMFFSKLLQDDLKFERGLVKGEFIEAESWTPDQYGTAPERIKINYPGLQHLLLYLNARLLWDPELNAKQTLDEYYRLFYGPAEKPMRGFWELVETNWNKKGWQSSPTQVYDTAVIGNLLDLLRQAQAKTVDGSDYRKRVELILSEFSPAAEVAQRLSSLAKPDITVPQVDLANAAETAPVLTSGTNLLQLLDRNYNVASPATNMQMGWDAQNLYINIRCYEPQMAKLKTLANKRDSLQPPIWEDDAVEFFLAPVPVNPADPTKTLHYIVTAGGAIYDSKISKAGQGEDSGFNGNAKVTVTREESRWVARVAIPWKDMDIPSPQAGRKFSANFYRSRYAAGQLEQTSWAPLMNGQFFSPQDFGQLTLGDKPAAAAPVDASIIVPTSEKEYGSGASLQGFYYDGGIPGIGLFVGQPNPLTRNDRAIFKFDLWPLLEIAPQIEKVELAFAVRAVNGGAATRVLNIQHFQKPLAATNAEATSRDDVDNAGDVTLSLTDVSKTRNQRIDVTAWVKQDLARGYASSSFRFRDVQAEKEGNPKGQPAGITLESAAGSLPALLITKK